MGFHIFKRSLHTGEDNHLVGKSLIDNDLCQPREIGHVVAIDAGSPFEFNHGKHILFDANVEVFLNGANVAGVGDAAARLGIAFGLQLFEGGICHGEVAAHGIGGFVVRNHIFAIGSDAHVAFQPIVAIIVNAIAEGFFCVHHTLVTSAVTHKFGFPCPCLPHNEQHSHHDNCLFHIFLIGWFSDKIGLIISHL